MSNERGVCTVESLNKTFVRQRLRVIGHTSIFTRSMMSVCVLVIVIKVWTCCVCYGALYHACSRSIARQPTCHLAHLVLYTLHIRITVDRGTLRTHALTSNVSLKRVTLLSLDPFLFSSLHELHLEVPRARRPPRARHNHRRTGSVGTRIEVGRFDEAEGLLGAGGRGPGKNTARCEKSGDRTVGPGRCRPVSAQSRTELRALLSAVQALSPLRLYPGARREKLSRPQSVNEIDAYLCSVQVEIPSSVPTTHNTPPAPHT